MAGKNNIFITSPKGARKKEVKYMDKKLSKAEQAYKSNAPIRVLLKEKYFSDYEAVKQIVGEGVIAMDFIKSYPEDVKRVAKLKEILADLEIFIKPEG